MTRMSIPVVDCSDDATLARLRTDFYSPPFPKNEAPPFRVQVARRPHGDLVQINTAHAAVDGIGMLRLLRSITDAYRGKAEAPPPLPLEEARDLKKQLGSETYSEFADRALEGGRKLKDAAIPPARVAPDAADSRTGSGFAHRTIAAEQVAELNARRPEGTTINDMLIGAVGIAVEEWNRQHNDDADKVMTFMPVNLRPAEWSTDVVSNMFSYVSVSTMSRDGPISPPQPGPSRSKRTRSGERLVRGGTQTLLRLISLSRSASRGACRAAGTHRKQVRRYRRCVQSGQAQGGGVVLRRPPRRVYFTPPYWSAAAISIGVITAGGTLYLGLRYRLSTLDQAAGNRLADLLVATLTQR
jgi:hypothetical protein